MTRRDFIHHAILKMLPNVFENIEELEGIHEDITPANDLKGCYEIVVEESINLANVAVMEWKKEHNTPFFDDDF